MRDVLARLDDEDRGRWSVNYVTMRAIEMNPGAYSRAETEAALREQLALYREFEAKYGIAPDVPWDVDAASGVILEACE